MTIARFLNYLAYAKDTATPPEGIHPLRWVAMLKWYTTRCLEGGVTKYPLR